MGNSPEPLPDHLVLLALLLCLVLTFALVYQFRPSPWYFDQQPTPGYPTQFIVAWGEVSLPTEVLLKQL